MAEHKWLFGFTVLLFIILFIIGLLILLSAFSFTGFTNYIVMAVYSLIFGFISGIVITKMTMSSRRLIMGSILVSGLSALLTFAFFTALTMTTEQSDVTSAIGYTGIPGNPAMLAAIIFVFFNLLFLINQLRIDTPDVEAKNLLLYVYGAIILAALCFISSLALNMIL